MKKNIEWLKNEIVELSIKARHKENNQREWHMGYVMALFDVNKLIDKLDEPEVLSQEWIDENEEQEEMYGSYGVPVHKLQNLLVPKQEITFGQAHDKLREESILSEKSFDYYWNCINDNVEIDEPGNILVPKQDKPVVPQFVADYIEQSKKDNDSINQVFAFMDDKEDKDLWHWLFPSMYEEKRANQEVFMRAWLDGYTIEKEPQWVVKDDTGYLSYLQFSIPNIYERETSLDKNGAYKFNSKSKADLIADLVTGTVEEVTE